MKALMKFPIMDRKYHNFHKYILSRNEKVRAILVSINSMNSQLIMKLVMIVKSKIHKKYPMVIRELMILVARRNYITRRWKCNHSNVSTNCR